MKKIDEVFEREIIEEVEQLENVELGDDVHVNGTKCIKELTDSLVKLKAAENEAKALELKERELDANAKNEKMKNNIAIGTTVVTVGAFIWGNVYNWNKELKGIMSSEGGRSSMRKVFDLLKFKN